MTLARPLLALCLLAASTAVLAGPTERYTQARFDLLAAQGKPALVAIHADWCPTCKAQKPILGKLMARPAYSKVTELVVDFDADKPTVRKYKVSMQSTLIAFKGGKEVGRSIGDTSAKGIEALIAKAAN